jgi:hypothetical protein
MPYGTIATCSYLVFYLNANMVTIKRLTTATEMNNNRSVSEPDNHINNDFVNMEADTVPVLGMNNETATVDEPNSMPNKKKICTWKPGSDEECIKLISTGLLGPSVHQWKLFGDSTMGRLFREIHRMDSRTQQEWKSCQCQSKSSGRCNMALDFELEKRKPWIPPDKSKGEGPIVYGLKNPHCMDCSGCSSRFVECNVSCPHFSTVSYFGVEFARDVEIQTKFANTTQENVALYLTRQQQRQAAMTTSNQRGLHDNDKSSGTVCVVNTGIHDVVLNLTVNTYVENVRWYLELLHPTVCQYIIWLYTTAPQTEDFLQKTSVLKKWNEAVPDMIAGHNELSRSSVIIDHFEASRKWPHNDNVHLNQKFYKALGTLLSRL